MEQDLLKPLDIPMHRITSGKFRRYPGRPLLENIFDLKMKYLNIRDFFKLIIGILMSLRLLWRIKPDVVFCKGGFASLPVGIAAWILKKPLVIHESDAHVGLANRILSKLTRYRISGFEAEGFLALGNPIREDLLVNSGNVAINRDDFGIRSDKPVVLAMGGSLGSTTLNVAVVGLVKSTDKYEIIHISGEGKALDAENMPHYHNYTFLGDQLASALNLADVVISRAGANTLVELAALGKAAVIVPHPSLSGDHQYRNARLMADAEAAVLLPQDELNYKRLDEVITKIVQDPTYRGKLENNIRRFANLTAADDIAKAVLDPKKAFAKE